MEIYRYLVNAPSFVGSYDLYRLYTYHFWYVTAKKSDCSWPFDVYPLPCWIRGLRAELPSPS